MGAGNKFKAQHIKSRSFRSFQYLFIFLTNAKERSGKGEKKINKYKGFSVKGTAAEWRVDTDCEQTMFCVQHLGCFLSKY